MSTRKLQQEFDKLQKKVNEGLQQFEEIYEKIGVTENPSLKEKLEGDLRKEIKKLQRSRDQVKQWLGDSGNKLDKLVLLDTRLRIENAMERFKEVEKVSKMKQFSNEGLELQTKLGARGADEARKNDASRYVVDVLEELARQNELLLGEIAHQSHKKRLASAQTALADLAAKMERNNAHVLRLEVVLRHLENYQLDPERIDEIRDDLDYYVENNQLADFVEYDDFYDLLELSEPPETAAITGAVTGGPGVLGATPGATSVAPESAAPAATPSPKKAAENKPAENKPAENKPAEKRSTDHKSKPEQSRVTITIGNSIGNPNGGSSGSSSGPSPPSSAPSSGGAAGLGPASSSGSSRPPPPGLNPQLKPGTPVPAKPTVAEELKKKAMTHAATKSPAQKPSPPAGAAAGGAAGGPSLASPLPVVEQRRQALASFWDNSASIATLAHDRVNRPAPFAAIRQQLEASLLNCPDSFDLERPRQYSPVNVHPSLVDYPQEPMYELNAAALMRKFDTDTLFFCFYYNEPQDALAKWHAARELLRRGWVFSLLLKQWFCKEDRPKLRSVAGGQNGGRTASYRYFDYERSWLVRHKENVEFGKEEQCTF